MLVLCPKFIHKEKVKKQVYHVLQTFLVISLFYLFYFILVISLFSLFYVSVMPEIYS